MSHNQQIHAALQTLQTNVQQALTATGSEEAVTVINDRFTLIFDAIDSGEEYTHLAQDAISNLITMHPNLTQLIPRELLWQLGGSCLHFLSDAEIDQFSAENALH